MPDLTLDSAILERSETDPSRLVIRLVPYGVTARTPQGLERFAPGAFRDVDIAGVHLESQRHGGDIVGLGEAIEEREDGAYGVFRVSDTTAGRDLLRLVADKILTAASVSFAAVKGGDEVQPDGAVLRKRVDLRRVAVLPRGAYEGAAVVALRKEHDVTDEIQATPEATPYDDKPILERMDGIDETIRTVQASILDRPDPEPELWRSWADAFDAFQTDEGASRELLQRALADNTYAANTGLHGQANTNRIIEPVAAKRRTINALGLAGLPAKGLTVDFIEFDDTNSTGYQGLVDAQSPEKSEIGTGTHIWTPASANVNTYAGGSDNSWQLLQRSDPSFRELLLRQYASEWAFATNGAFVAAVEAGGTADTLTLGADTSALIAKLIDQSIAIEALVDRPADVVLCATDVWSAIAKLPDLLPPNYGTVNLPGTMSAAGLNVNISGLRIQHEPRLTAGRMVTSVSGGEAAAFHESFQGIATQDVVSKLGTDIAVWGYGSPIVYRAGAVFVTVVTLV